MIRPLTLVTMVAAMGAGLHVYQTKHAVALLDRELRGIARAIEDQNERSLALSAEWAWLNEPDRLRQAANRHLALEPMMPGQFVRYSEFERRLPQVTGFDGPPALFAARDQTGATSEANGAMRLELAERPGAAPGLRVTLAAVAGGTRPAQAAPVVAPATPVPAAAAPPVAAPPLPVPAAVPTGLAAVAAAALPAASATPRAEAPIAPVAAHSEPPVAPVAARSEPTVAPVAARSEPPVTPVVARSEPPAQVSRRIAAPRPAPRHAADLAALPPVAGPARPVEAQRTPSRTPAVVRTQAPAYAASAPPAPAGSMLGAGTRTALAPPVPYGSLPPPVPFASASAAR